MESRLNAGQVNQLAVLNAQQTCLTAAVIRVQTEANRLADTAALFLALGGGWPATCTTPVWRQCAMGEGPPPPPNIWKPEIAFQYFTHAGSFAEAYYCQMRRAWYGVERLRRAKTSGGETNDQRNEGG